MIIPTPYWVSYPPMVELAGAKPIIVDTKEEDDYQVTGELIKKYITSKTKGIVLNYPSNPVGSVYTVENLAQIGKLAVEHNLYIVSDEMYEKLVYDGYKHTSIASIDNAFKERTIISNGVSKAYSMTGWRIGYTAGQKAIISAMSNIQSQSTSNPTSISQYAACHLTGPQDFIATMVSEFQKRRDYLVRELTSIPELPAIIQGALFTFSPTLTPCSEKYKDKAIDSSASLTELLLEENFIRPLCPELSLAKKAI